MTAPSSAQTEPLGSNELSNENVVKTHSRSIPNGFGFHHPPRRGRSCPRNQRSKYMKIKTKSPKVPCEVEGWN